MITASCTINNVITATAQFANQTVSAGDTTAPTFSSGPASASVLDTSFNITATLNEWGTVYSLVQAAATAAPSVATIIASGESAADTGSGVTISHTGLTASTDYTAYVVAKDDDGNTQASATEVDVTTGSGYDASTQAWFGAGSFSTANKDIMDDFVLNLKTGITNATDVWSDIIALYVMCWGGSDSTSSNDAINGKNPGTYTITFVNSPTFAAGGVTFNGTSQYARTGVIPSSHLTNDDLTISSYQVNNVANTSGMSFGARISSTQIIRSTPRTGADQIQIDCYNGALGRLLVANTDSSGLITYTRRSTTDAEAYRNTTTLGNDTDNSGTSVPTCEFYLYAQNNDGTAANFYNNICRVAMIGNGMTDNQVADWSAAVSQLMTDLGI